MKEKIRAMIDTMRNLNLSVEEKAVMNCILMTFTVSVNGKQKKITQTEIARGERWLGSQNKFEHPSEESTLRKVRQVIRDLRLKQNAPILSDRDGYWIPSQQGEVDEYLKNLEITAKAQTKAWFETYRAMQQTFEVKSDYFEKQNSLFP